MGVLKVRSNGQWINVGVGGGPLPPGGVLGDILVKQSANPSDAVWGTTMPKLTIGGTDPGQFPTTLTIGEPTHATSRRAFIKLGLGYEVGQDAYGTGTKDFFVWSVTGNRTALQMNDVGYQMIVGTSMTIGQHPAHNAAGLWTGGFAPGSTYRFLAFGNDTYINSDGGNVDLRINNASGLKLDVNRNVTLSNGLYFPGGASIRWTSEFVVSSPAVLTHLGSGHNWLNAAGNAWHMQHDGTKLWVPQSIYSDAQIYCGDGQFFRARGSGGVYWESWGGGWYMTDSTWVRIYGGKWLDTAGGVLTTRGGMIRVGADPNDANHSLAYSSEAAAAIDPGSGVGSNGPKLQGYSTVWLRTAVNGYSFLFYDKNSYLTSAGVYSKFSSRELKDEIEPLDPDRCLSDVARWQPVDYIVKQNPEMGRLDGFIAEDLDEVSPQLVVHTAPGSERENRPHAIDYGALTPRLAGAVQALLRRIEQLEGKVA